MLNNLSAKKTLSALIFLSLSMALIFQASKTLAQDDDDFIILDDRGEEDRPTPQARPKTVEPAGDDEDLPMSGRPRASTDSADGGNSSAAPVAAPPRRFEPSERVSEDLSVSFPADI